jgi:NAD(P)-dependent dehydrogenase (short-subunit alcohol dehydrogenase family)
MNQPRSHAVLITGANAGLGKDVTRQLANLGKFGTIYLACRNNAKAAIVAVKTFAYLITAMTSSGPWPLLPISGRGACS